MTMSIARPNSTIFRLTAEEGERMLRILTDARLTQCHFELFLWLQGDVQHFLPHQILIAAWGDFRNWKLKLDVVSALPGVRTGQLAHCDIDDFVRTLFARWVNGGRQPLVVCAAEALRPLRACKCPMHSAFRALRSVLVHGVRDERGGYDSLYVALNSRSFTNGHPKDRCSYLVDLLIPEIDVAFRKVGAYRLVDTRGAATVRSHWFDLSAREQEILDVVSKGKTNLETAQALHISAFTVKNHVQRILKKLGASNRTQASATYIQAFQESRKALQK